MIAYPTPVLTTTEDEGEDEEEEAEGDSQKRVDSLACIKLMIAIESQLRRKGRGGGGH